MKIIFIFIPFVNNGGAEKAAVNLCNNLANNFKIFLILLNKKNFKKGIVNKNVTVISLKKKRLLFSFYALGKLIIKFRPDYILSFMYANSIVSTFSKIIFLSKSKLIFCIQNNPTEIINNSKNQTYIKTLFKVFKLCTIFSYKIITCSKNLCNDVKKFCFQKSKVISIYNPVIESDFLKKSLIFDKDLNKFEKKFKNILAIGRLENQKNFEFLIRSFKKINSSDKYKLFIIGSGSKKKQLKRLVLGLKMNNEIYFLGEKKNVYNFIKKCDFFVLTSKWEGLGNVLVESLYFNKNIISSNCEFGPGEILKDGKIGHLYKNNNVKDFIDKFSFPRKKSITKLDYEYFMSSNVKKKFLRFLS